MRFFTWILLFALAPVANASITLSKSFVSLSARTGSYGTSDTIWVRNMGLDATHISLFNNCFADFRVSHSCFGNLNPNSSCTIQIQFSPRTRGRQSCSISVNSSMGGSRNISVSGNAY